MEEVITDLIKDVVRLQFENQKSMDMIQELREELAFLKSDLVILKKEVVGPF